MILKRTLFLCLTFILIFSTVALVGCTKANEKPLVDEERMDMENALDNNAYNYENKANRLYGYFGSGNGYTRNNGYNNNYGYVNPGLDNPNPNGNMGNNMGMNNNYGLGFGGNNTATNNAMNFLTGSQSSLVRKLESHCNKVKGVKDTTIVKKGNTCYVGCDLNNNSNNANVRSQCSNKIKSLDPTITNIVFTSDKNAKSKLETMIRNINIGRPARGFMTDLENLFR